MYVWQNCMVCSGRHIVSCWWAPPITPPPTTPPPITPPPITLSTHHPSSLIAAGGQLGGVKCEPDGALLSSDAAVCFRNQLTYLDKNTLHDPHSLYQPSGEIGIPARGLQARHSCTSTCTCKVPWQSIARKSSKCSSYWLNFSMLSPVLVWQDSKLDIQGLEMRPTHMEGDRTNVSRLTHGSE